MNNNKGVTLVEVLISLVVLLIVFMGLIQASLLSIDHNLRNDIRDEAVRVAAEYITRIKSLTFSDVNSTYINDPTKNVLPSASAAPSCPNLSFSDCSKNPRVLAASLPTINRNFRNLPPFPFYLDVQLCPFGSDTEVQVTVIYQYRNEPCVSQSASTVIKGP